MNLSRDDPSIKYYSRLKELHDPSMTVVSFSFPIHFFERKLMRQNDSRFLQLKMEIMNEIQTKYIPENVLTNVSRCKVLIVQS
jgi:hypothetical protein